LQNGKQLFVTHWTLSEDGKMMRGMTNGADSQGNPFEQLEIRDRKKLFLPSIDPTTAGVGLAFWAMPILACIRVAGISAIRIRAFIQVIAEISRAASLDGSENLQMLRGDPCTAVFDELLSRSTDDIGHLERWPLHHVLAGVSGLIVLFERVRESSGLTAVLKCRFDT